MAGVFKAVDSVDFFVQALDLPVSVLSVTTTATNNFAASADIKNTVHKGAVLFLAVTSLSTISTIGININGKDPVTGNYMLVSRVSLDSVPAGAGNYAAEIYPGLTDTGGASAAGFHRDSAVLPAIFQVVASTVVAGGAGTIAFKMGMSKIL
jgi:hypothetical protein